MLGYTRLPTDLTQRVKHLSNGGTLVVHRNTYTYAYGPPGLKGVLHNSFAFRCSLFASLGGLTFGYDQGVIANVLIMKDFLARWPITPWQKGVMTAVLELGALAGALTAGIMADRYSRRRSICLACAVFCLGSAFQCLATSLPTLIIGRAIGGFGIGALSMLSPLYIGEISAPESRGALLALEQLSIVIGVVLGFWFGFFTRTLPGSSSWRLPLGFQILPGVLLGIGCLSLPPSPRLLVHRGDTAEALRSLARLRFPQASDISDEDQLIQLELLEIRIEAALSSSGTDGPRSQTIGWAQLFEPKYIHRTLIGIFVMFWQQWSGINALLYYGPALIQSIGFSGDSALLLGSGFINIVQLFAVFPTILWIDGLGRKPLLIGTKIDQTAKVNWNLRDNSQVNTMIKTGGAAVMGISHATISYLIWTSSSDWASHKVAAWLGLGCVYLFTAAYGVSFGPIAWVLPSEVFPVSVRGQGVSISTASNWFNNFLIGLVTPTMVEISAAGTYFVFALACFSACIWSVMIVPETARVSLEEMDELFNSSAGREDRELRTRLEEDMGLNRLLRQMEVDVDEDRE